MADHFVLFLNMSVSAVAFKMLIGICFLSQKTASGIEKGNPLFAEYS